MAVFTPVSDDQARAFVAGYPALGDFVSLHAIAEGVQNTNYRLETTAGRFVLTLFEQWTETEALPFCLGFTDHLADKGFPAARPVRTHDGGWVGELNGKAAAVVGWLQGAWIRDLSLKNQRAGGATLARLHLAMQDFPGTRLNPVGPVQWRELADASATEAKGEDRAILDKVESALARLGSPWPDRPDADEPPQGAIHADYFPDNVLFDGDEVSGVIDFYFGCTGPLAYDLAIALSAWGFDAEGRELPGAVQAFRDGYESVRPLTPAEAEALPRLGEFAAIRFTLTRLRDRIFHDPANLVTPKDPAAFVRRLDYWRVAEPA